MSVSASRIYERTVSITLAEFILANLDTLAENFCNTDTGEPITSDEAAELIDRARTYLADPSGDAG